MVVRGASNIFFLAVLDHLRDFRSSEMIATKVENTALKLVLQCDGVDPGTGYEKK